MLIVSLHELETSQMAYVGCVGRDRAQHPHVGFQKSVRNEISRTGSGEQGPRAAR